MTDAQIIGMVASTGMAFCAVLLGVLLNNTRLNDLRADTRSAMGDLRDMLRAEIKSESKDLAAQLIRLQENMHAQIAGALFEHRATP